MKKLPAEQTAAKYHINDTIELPCLECGAKYTFKLDSNEATGVFNVFCPGGDCEDRYAAKQ